MARPRITVAGQNALIKKIKAFGDRVNTTLEGVTRLSAENIADKAVLEVPVNFGKLKQSIKAEKKTQFRYNIIAQEKYAAYVEFGTGAFVKVAPEWEDLAMSYYVNGEGFLRSHPYLYPAWKSEGIVYEKNLQKMLDRLTAQFNR